MYTHDEVGNRLSRSDARAYGWDQFNRLIYGSEDGYDLMYYYLPSGLRTTKIGGNFFQLSGFNWSGFYDEDDWSNWPTTRYRYDGQMTLEEDVTYYREGDYANEVIDETRYTLGARGIESIVAERLSGASYGGVTQGVEYRSFPVYNGHGNMISTLQRSGTDSHTLGAEKRYNAWGGVIASANTGGHLLRPNKQYCATLGHTKDDETGLIYMRARYYEPSTGRFLSEDPARDGWNWYVYVDNSPTVSADPDGTISFSLQFGMIAGLVFAVEAVLSLRMGNPVAALQSAIAAVGYFALCFSASKYLEGEASPNQYGVSAGSLLANGLPGNKKLGFVSKFGLPSWIKGILPNSLSNAANGSSSHASIAVMAVFAYTLVLMGALLAIEVNSE